MAHGCQLSLTFWSVWDHIKIYTQKLTRWKLQPLDYCCYSMNALTWVFDASSLTHSFPVYVELHLNSNNFTSPLCIEFASICLFSCFFASFYLLKFFCFVSVRTTFNVISFFSGIFWLLGWDFKWALQQYNLGLCWMQGKANKPKSRKNRHQSKLAEKATSGSRWYKYYTKINKEKS